ncbi:integrase family protein (plasmid) [Gloeocapsa sp. PCC 7428]|uniref:tyrosine-type recombinase/integrase n=1 Tax=Gloeocapsa sp. PCC 7428 TaxID=1173026 RepID=UPI0002A5CB8C|nr:integrase family protein [Gloeocapsa sp. PCC 7428]
MQHKLSSVAFGMTARTPFAQTELSPLDAQERLLSMWLHGKSPHTQSSYRLAATRFLEFVSKPLHLVTLAEVQGFATHLAESNLSANTQRTTLSAVKSLLKFGNQIEVLSANVGASVSPPKAKDTLTERILTELEVQAMIALETKERNRAMLRLLYGGGLRVSELCALKWRDLTRRGDTGQATVFGKGSKTRVVLLPATIWQELTALRGNALADAPVFQSRKQGGHLTRSQVMRIVQAAAKRAGIDAKVSPHWLRHAHASHSLDRGAPIHLVQQTLGHSSIATTSRYLHARPQDSSARFLPL